MRAAQNFDRFSIKSVENRASLIANDHAVLNDVDRRIERPDAGADADPAHEEVRKPGEGADSVELGIGDKPSDVADIGEVPAFDRRAINRSHR